MDGPEQEAQLVALFRHSLLRFCFRPGLQEKALEAKVHLAEIRLLHTLRMWMYPELLAGFRQWQRKVDQRGLMVVLVSLYTYIW